MYIVGDLQTGIKCLHLTVKIADFCPPFGNRYVFSSEYLVFDGKFCGMTIEYCLTRLLDLTCVKTKYPSRSGYDDGKCGEY